MALPQTVRNILDEMTAGIDSWWPDPETNGEQESPLWRLIVAFGSQEDGSEAPAHLSFQRRLLLALYAARRALVCWELYCDGEEPHAAVAAVEAWIASDTRPADWRPLCRPAPPAFRGHAIVDCRACDTGAAAAAAAHAVLFLRDGALVQAYRAIASADGAFDQSPLCKADHFRRWLIEVAAPAAYENRDLTPAERDALRDYDVSETPAERERYWQMGG
jgi:hypothetical protein